MQLARRDFLRVGPVAVAALGASPALAAPGRKPRSVILIFLDGGTSHIDLFDIKPEAPAEIRGPFQPIATSVPGVRVCEHLPGLARRMHKVLQLRSVHHTDAIHDPAVYLTLTGKRHPTPLGGLKHRRTTTRTSVDCSPPLVRTARPRSPDGSNCPRR